MTVGAYDFLGNSKYGPSQPNFGTVPRAMSTGDMPTNGNNFGMFGGGGLSDLFHNPNFIQLLAGIGSALGSSKLNGAGAAASAIGNSVSNMTRNIQNQNAYSGAINNLNPTPKGQAGPDSITTKQTADGTTTTIQTPSKANLNSYGTSTPPETQSAKSSGSGGSGGEAQNNSNGLTSAGLGSSGLGAASTQGDSGQSFWKALLQ